MTEAEFTASRQAWIAKGRPADPTDAYWATVLEAEAARIEGNGYSRRYANGAAQLIEPLVRLGY